MGREGGRARVREGWMEEGRDGGTEGVGGEQMEEGEGDGRTGETGSVRRGPQVSGETPAPSGPLTHSLVPLRARSAGVQTSSGDGAS
jgi:hypothetical protein